MAKLRGAVESGGKTKPCGMRSPRVGSGNSLGQGTGTTASSPLTGFKRPAEKEAEPINSNGALGKPASEKQQKTNDDPTAGSMKTVPRGRIVG